MFIADTHSDTLYVLGVTHEQHPMITPERLKQGGITLQTFAMWTGRDGNKGDYEAIVAAEIGQVPGCLAKGLKQVDDPSEAVEGENAFMLSIEGGEVFEKDLSTVEAWRQKGVRMAALLWNNDNRLGYPAKHGDKRGLTDYGVAVVKEMQRVKMAVDTSHLNEAGFYDIFAKTNHAPLASHSCCKALCDHPRNLTDDQLRLLIRNGGYVGVNFYPYFLSDDGKADVKRVAEHIDHICQMGGEKIVGFGSDFDGIEVTPDGLENPAQVPNLLEELHRRGYTEEAVEGVAGKNLLRYFANL